MKSRNRFAKLLVGGLLVAASPLMAAKPANAALLANYELNGNANAVTAPGVDATNFTDGPGMTNAHYSIRFTPNQTRSITFRDLKSTSVATATNLGTYFSFKVDAEAGQRIKFTSLDFGTDAGTMNGPAGTFGTFFVRASTDGGATFQDVPPAFTEIGDNNPNNFTDRTASLAGLTGGSGGFFTQPVEFRIYLYDSGANNNSGGLRIDDVRLNGQVAPVPELSTGLLVALSLGGMCIIGLRRKKTAQPGLSLAI